MKHIIKHISTACCCLTICLFISLPAAADSMMENPLTPPDTSSPQSTLNSYLKNITKCYQILQKAFLLDVESKNIFTHTPEVLRMKEEATLHFQKAIDCLDLSQVPAVYKEEYSKEVVIQLKEILDRIHLPAMSRVPSMENDNNKLKLWRIPKTPIEIVLMEEGLRSGEFLFSAETVAAIPALYKLAKKIPYRNLDTQNFFKFYISTPGSLLPPKWFHYIPTWMSAEIYYGETIFQWLMLGLSIIFLVCFISFAYKHSSRHRDVEDHPVRSDLLRISLPVLLAILAHWMLGFLEEIVNLSGDTLHYTTAILDVITWLAAAWAVVTAGSLVANIIIASPNVNPQSIDASLIRTIAYLASISLAICVLFYGGSNLGLPLIPVVTGFGVIGLAVSLAAKPTIENIIGGLTLFADKPVKIGEYCAFDDQWGKVLHIGLRSTRVRAGDRTVISIPNAIFSQMKLVNLDRRDVYRFSERIQLRNETSGTQLRWIMARIREMLIAHPKVLSKYLYRVKLDALNTYSKTVRVYTFIEGDLEWEDYLEVRQDLLFRISDIIEEAGSAIALPSQSLYLIQDETKIQAPQPIIDAMQNPESHYPHPLTHEETYEDLLDRLRYPPEHEGDFSGLALKPKEPLSEKKKNEKKKESVDIEEDKDSFKVYRR